MAGEVAARWAGDLVAKAVGSGGLLVDPLLVVIETKSCCATLKRELLI